eukprot:CAMPEP_0119350076 /NCGR_PEP_ID=MMETSP1333-20130426/109875_1 /TAXON_ID=418940 /ORGANISM="Scyphosphaera apsteinii, Strain RCC1455" /LENGTH=40 /DNA_ID= /DNA_START= /DNA_END= /DNA_ORIENTATION=
MTWPSSNMITAVCMALTKQEQNMRSGFGDAADTATAAERA